MDYFIRWRKDQLIFFSAFQIIYNVPIVWNIKTAKIWKNGSILINKNSLRNSLILKHYFLFSKIWIHKNSKFLANQLSNSWPFLIQEVILNLNNLKKLTTLCQRYFIMYSLFINTTWKTNKYLMCYNQKGFYVLKYYSR